MPINCRVRFPRLTDDEMQAIDYRVMSHAFASQNELGRLCDESIYQANLAGWLIAAGFVVRIEEPIVLNFRNFSTTLFMDLVVDDRVPYELKAVNELAVEHEDQLLNYLLLTNACRGKVVNFRSESVPSRFVNATLTLAERQRFEIEACLWTGDPAFQRLVTELISDWGTCLDQANYSQAIVECLGGKDRVARELPMESNGSSLGNQRFLMATDTSAFRLTTFPNGPTREYASHLRKLLGPSPLKEFYWVNVGRHRLDFQTVDRRED